MAMTKEVLPLGTTKVVAHLKHALHELEVMFAAILDAVEATFLSTPAAISGLLDEGCFWTGIPTSAGGGDPELQSCVLIISQPISGS